MRIRLGGWYSEDKQSIKAEIRKLAKHGTIDKAYVSKEKIKEMEDYGYAYINKGKEFIV
jgi:hypothetical protein